MLYSWQAVPMGTAVPSRWLVRFGVFEVDLRAGELRKQGVKLKLQEQPFQVLALLLEHPGELVNREELQHKLWPADTFVDFDTGLNNAIKKLRDALGDEAETPRFIETLPRRGYRFIYPVDGAAAEVSQPAAWWRRRWVAGVLGVIGVTAGLLAGNVGGLRDRLFGARAPRIESVAVLPLENLSGDPEQEYLVDGMTEALITELGKISSLRVISRQSVIRYKGSKKSLPEITRELNVDAMVEGAVVRVGDRVRITVKLIHTSRERNLWAESYERDLGDLLRLQGEIAQTIAHQVQIRLTPEEQARLASSRPVNPEAYAAYLKGRYHFSQATKGGTLRAKEYFEKAVEIEPTLALAYASLAELYARGGPAVTKDLRGPYWDARPKAREWAEKALELDDAVGEAHTALARVAMMEWDWAAAEREFRRAIDLNPSYPLTRVWYAEYLKAMLQSEKALEQVKLARQLDPVSPFINSRVGWAYLATGRVEEAIVSFREVLELEPNPLEPTYLSPRVGLGQAQIRKGMYTEAVEELEKALASDEKNPFALGTLACAYAKLGRREEALKIVSELKRRMEREPVPAAALVYAYVGLGDKDQAFAWLEEAYERRAWLWHLTDNRMLDPLRSDPRYADLLRRVGLPTEGLPGPQTVPVRTARQPQSR